MPTAFGGMMNSANRTERASLLARSKQASFFFRLEAGALFL